MQETKIDNYPILWLDSAETLALLPQAHEIFGQSIYIDTEFTKKTQEFLPHLSLIQIFCDEKIYVIDFLAIQSQQLDTSHLREMLNNHDILKVFHSGQQDIELLNYNLNLRINNVFDTQIAAMFCGFKTAPSYQNLVKHYLQRVIPKELQFSDWLQRPISAERLNYVALDVALLQPLREILLADLAKNGKLDWFNEDMLLPPEINRTSIEKIFALSKKLFDKFDINKISPKKLAYSLALCDFREKKAHHENKARETIIKDNKILEITDWMQEKAFLTKCSSELLELEYAVSSIQYSQKKINTAIDDENIGEYSEINNNHQSTSASLVTKSIWREFLLKKLPPKLLDHIDLIEDFLFNFLQNNPKKHLSFYLKQIRQLSRKCSVFSSPDSNFNHANKNRDELIIEPIILAMANNAALKNNIALNLLLDKKNSDAIAANAGSVEGTSLHKGWRYQVLGRNVTNFFAGGTAIRWNKIENKIVYE